jgi:hypothetical protein
MGFSRFGFCLVFLNIGFGILPLSSQTAPEAQAAAEDPASFIGLTLEELVGRFGIPHSVYAVRGLEEWQDDVVFVYAQGDFYVFKDRVWQVGLKSAYRVRAGDPRGVVFLIFQEADDRGGYALCPLSGQDWPLTLRYNFDGTGKVSEIFIYRSDL